MGRLLLGTLSSHMSSSFLGILQTDHNYKLTTLPRSPDPLGLISCQSKARAEAMEPHNLPSWSVKGYQVVLLASQD